VDWVIKDSLGHLVSRWAWDSWKIRMPPHTNWSRQTFYCNLPLVQYSNLLFSLNHWERTARLNSQCPRQQCQYCSGDWRCSNQVLYLAFWQVRPLWRRTGPDHSTIPRSSTQAGSTSRTECGGVHIEHGSVLHFLGPRHLPTSNPKTFDWDFQPQQFKQW